MHSNSTPGKEKKKKRARNNSTATMVTAVVVVVVMNPGKKDVDGAIYEFAGGMALYRLSARKAVAYVHDLATAHPDIQYDVLVAGSLYLVGNVFGALDVSV